MILAEKNHAPVFVEKVHSCKICFCGTTVSRGANISVPMRIFKPAALTLQKGLSHFSYPEVIYRTDNTESELG